MLPSKRIKLIKNIVGYSVIILLCLWYSVFRFAIEMEIREKEVSGIIGSKVLYGKEEVIVEKYDFWLNSYTLSNGKDVSYDYIVRFQLKKDSEKINIHEAR